MITWGSLVNYLQLNWEFLCNINIWINVSYVSHAWGTDFVQVNDKLMSVCSYLLHFYHLCESLFQITVSNQSDVEPFVWLIHGAGKHLKAKEQGWRGLDKRQISKQMSERFYITLVCWQMFMYFYLQCVAPLLVSISIGSWRQPWPGIVGSKWWILVQNQRGKQWICICNEVNSDKAKQICLNL